MTEFTDNEKAVLRPLLRALREKKGDVKRAWISWFQLEISSHLRDAEIEKALAPLVAKGYAEIDGSGERRRCRITLQGEREALQAGL